MNKDDVSKLIPDTENIKASLEKTLKKNSVSMTSKNNLVTVVMNYQQEITDLVIDNRLLDPGKSGALKSSLIEALNRAIITSRKKMLSEAAKAVKLFK
ncbi:MAG: YbaB/EbfC family nucleoid-associated protein [Chitinophagales bacterium]